MRFRYLRTNDVDIIFYYVEILGLLCFIRHSSLKKMKKPFKFLSKKLREGICEIFYFLAFKERKYFVKKKEIFPKILEKIKNHRKFS